MYLGEMLTARRPFARADLWEYIIPQYELAGMQNAVGQMLQMSVSVALRASARHASMVTKSVSAIDYKDAVNCCIRNRNGCNF